MIFRISIGPSSDQLGDRGRIVPDYGSHKRSLERNLRGPPQSISVTINELE